MQYLLGRLLLPFISFFTFFTFNIWYFPNCPARSTNLIAVPRNTCGCSRTTTILAYMHTSLFQASEIFITLTVGILCCRLIIFTFKGWFKFSLSTRCSIWFAISGRSYTSSNFPSLPSLCFLIKERIIVIRNIYVLITIINFIWVFAIPIFILNYSSTI